MVVEISVFKLINKKQNEVKTAIVFQDKKVTYKELVSLSVYLSDIITSRFKSIRESIGIFICGSLDYAVAFFSIIYSNKVVVPLNVNMKKPELIRILEYLKIRIIITNEVFYERLVRLTDTQVNIICIKNNYNVSIIASTSFVKKFAYKEELEDVALILHTSGSFASPKSVMLTHDNLMSCAASIAEDLNVTEKDTTLIMLPMYYASAVISQFLTHLLVGGTIVFMDTIFTPYNLFFNIEKYEITNFSCVPGMLLSVLNQLNKILKCNYSSLRYLCFGGESAPGEKINRLVRCFRNVKFVKTYGLTEASTRVSHYIEAPNIINSDCVGIPIPNVEVKIVDENSLECQAGEVGEVIVTGSNIMKGYCMRKHETQKILQNGWLHTGDFGMIDGNNNLHIVGRKKNIIIRNGENIYPEEIEEIINNHPWVQESLVYGKSHEVFGEVPIAEIVVNDDVDSELQKLIEYCYAHMSNTKVPVKFIVVKSIARTDNGKILRKI